MSKVRLMNAHPFCSAAGKAPPHTAQGRCPRLRASKRPDSKEHLRWRIEGCALYPQTSTWAEAVKCDCAETPEAAGSETCNLPRGLTSFQRYRSEWKPA